MNIQILSPVQSVFSGKVDSVQVPGKNGSFHMLKNHAPIVSILGEGEITLYTHKTFVENEDLQKYFQSNEQDSKIFGLKIKGGIIELNKNKLIILID
jgi:F-type H+-transporting ATPase subunit epsilon